MESGSTNSLFSFIKLKIDILNSKVQEFKILTEVQEISTIEFLNSRTWHSKVRGIFNFVEIIEKS